MKNAEYIRTEKSCIRAGERLTVGNFCVLPVRLLGKGKGGYSWLAEISVQDAGSGAQKMPAVLKQLHHEPCAYYAFGDKFAAEMSDYNTLRALSVPLPELLASDRARDLLLKTYISGKNVMDLARERRVPPAALEQVSVLAERLCKAGWNLDWWPTNFILRETDGKIFYVDYECNAFDGRWSFPHWGRRVWLEGDGEYRESMKEALEEGKS